MCPLPGTDAMIFNQVTKDRERERKREKERKDTAMRYIGGGNMKLAYANRIYYVLTEKKISHIHSCLRSHTQMMM